MRPVRSATGFLSARSSAMAVVLLSALTLLCQACQSPDRRARHAHEEQERFVRLDVRAGDSSPEGPARFAHPVVLNSAEWTRILAGIRVQLRKDSVLFTRELEPPTEAFTPDEIIYLSRSLSEAFAKARPDEWVVFGMSRVLPSGPNEITTGGWFAEGTRLHLHLANYRHSVTRTVAREQLWNEPLRALAAPFYDVVQDERHTVVQNAGLLSALSSGSGPEIVIKYLPLPAVEKAAPAPATGPRLTPAAAEERLQALKRMREQGLITNEEYREKRKEILGSF